MPPPGPAGCWRLNAPQGLKDATPDWNLILASGHRGFHVSFDAIRQRHSAEGDRVGYAVGGREDQTQYCIGYAPGGRSWRSRELLRLQERQERSHHLRSGSRRYRGDCQPGRKDSGEQIDETPNVSGPFWVSVLAKVRPNVLIAMTMMASLGGAISYIAFI